MNALTQSIAIRGVDLSDRLVMPPMASGKPNPDGTVSDSLEEYYKEKSQGGYLGLVITEHAFVCQQGKAHGGQLSIAREEDIPGLCRDNGLNVHSTWEQIQWVCMREDIKHLFCSDRPHERPLS